MLSTSPDVVVIGGGIIGLCATIAAADRGLRVTLVDDAKLGAASRASAGMLGPSLEGLPLSVQHLAFAGRDLYPDTIARLRADAGVHVPLDRSGIVEIAADEKELESLWRRSGSRAERLDNRELASLESGLATHAGAVLHPHDGWVDNRLLMEALAIVAERHPRVNRLIDRVVSLDSYNADANVRLESGATIACRRSVLATGAWGSALPGMPRPLPVHAVKGELLTLDHRSPKHVVYGSAGYLIPRDGITLVGATSENAVLDSSASDRGRAVLTTAASALMPTLGSARVVNHWGGLRPCSPDGLPIIGPDPDQPALIYAAGFSRNGILLGPWAGIVLASLLAGDPDPVIPPQFIPQRFASENNRS